jgi:HPt (histidine-containing phosphotransfer) domain-containing protein
VAKRKGPIEVDLRVIEELANGDPAELAALIEMFNRHTTEGIAKVRAAIGAQQFQEAARTAHTCIGFTATIGITAMLPTLRELERIARAERRKEATRLVAQWEQEFKQARQALQARMDGPGTSQW